MSCLCAIIGCHTQDGPSDEPAEDSRSPDTSGVLIWRGQTFGCNGRSDIAAADDVWCAIHDGELRREFWNAAATWPGFKADGVLRCELRLDTCTLKTCAFG